MSSRIADPSLWREGLEAIAWAREFMPVTRVLLAEAKVAGVRIAVSDVLEPKTAALALGLAQAGADVAVTCSGRNTDDRVAAALDHEGVPVYAYSTAGRTEDIENTLLLLDHRPQVIIDDGSDTIRLAHTERPGILADAIGATEQTTSGLRPLRSMVREGLLRIPVVAANDARAKTLFDNAHGTGQSTVFAIADLLGEPLGGRDVVVIGFGYVGSSVARHVAALGGRVTVSELDPVRALEAVLAGFAVESLAAAARHADLLISATGAPHTVEVAILELLPEGAAVAVAGGTDQEIALDDALAAGAVRGEPVRKVSRWELPGGRSIRVLDDGHCINVSAAEGNPVEIMDLSFAVQLSAVDQLLQTASGLEPGVYPLSRERDDRVAALKLETLGLDLDIRSASQQAAYEQWRPRTS